MIIKTMNTRDQNEMDPKAKQVKNKNKIKIKIKS